MRFRVNQFHAGRFDCFLLSGLLLEVLGKNQDCRVARVGALFKRPGSATIPFKEVAQLLSGVLKNSSP
jgi:hypothetical protein